MGVSGDGHGWKLPSALAPPQVTSKVERPDGVGTERRWGDNQFMVWLADSFGIQYPAFSAFLGSLGLHTSTGRPRKAWDTFCRQCVKRKTPGVRPAGNGV
jgi:hypothetical protein